MTQWFDIHIYYKMINFTLLYPSTKYDPISTPTIKLINQKAWKNALPIDKEINMVGFKYSTDVETKKSQSIENNCNINSLNKKMKLCKPPENFQ